MAIIRDTGSLTQVGEVVEFTASPANGREAVAYIGAAVVRGIGTGTRKPLVTLGFLVSTWTEAERALAIMSKPQFILEETSPAINIRLEATVNPIARMVPIPGRQAMFRVDVTGAQQ